MAYRTCDNCGESFQTLTELRLHDCPKECGLIDDAFLPKPQPDELPDRVLQTNEFEALENDPRIEGVTKMMDMPLPGDGEAISFIVKIDEHAYGLHCDHDTAEWSIVTEGPDLDEVRKAHSEWLAEDIGKVTGGSPNPERLDG